MGVARAETCLPSAVLAIVLPDATLAAPMPAASTLAIASGLYTCRQPVQRRVLMRACCVSPSRSRQAALRARFSRQPHPYDAVDE